MFRKMVEQALGELLQEMAPTRPTIDPESQRRRPDMAHAPGDGEVRRAIGEARVEPVRPAANPQRRRPIDPADMEGRRANMGEGRNAPREVILDEGRRAIRDVIAPEGNRPPLQASTFRPAIAESPAMTVNRRRPVNPMRAQLTSPASVRNAFRVMEILRPPVALRGLPGQERDR